MHVLTKQRHAHACTPFCISIMCMHPSARFPIVRLRVPEIGITYYIFIVTPYPVNLYQLPAFLPGTLWTACKGQFIMNNCRKYGEIKKAVRKSIQHEIKTHATVGYSYIYTFSSLFFKESHNSLGFDKVVPSLMTMWAKRLSADTNISSVPSPPLSASRCDTNFWINLWNCSPLNWAF